MASIALMPVCIGSPTGWRPMIDGRLDLHAAETGADDAGPCRRSARRGRSRPGRAWRRRRAPTGCGRWPSPSGPPRCPRRRRAPRRRSSPRRGSGPGRAVPSSNSSSSLTPHSGRPATRAMPSPTWVTRPTVRASSDGSKPSRCFLSAAAMSAVEMVSSAIGSSVLPRASGLELVEAGADGAVDDGVADGGDEAAEHRGIDDHLHLDLLAGGVGEGGGQPVLLVVGERDGRADLGDGAVLLGGGPLDELGDDGGQVLAAAGADDEADELASWWATPCRRAGPRRWPGGARPAPARR